MRGVARAATERARLIRECKASGLGAKAFAVRSGIPASTVYQWLAADARARSVRIARVVRRPSTRGSDTEPSPAPTPLVVELDRARIHVGGGFEPAVLAAVLDVLDARRRNRPI
jgi:hypothetical protein